MDAWKYDTAQDLDRTVVERLRGFPREPDILVYALRWLAALTIRGWQRCYHRFTIRGREHLPKSESFVLVANHASHLDALCLLSALPLSKVHRAFPAAAHDYFFVSVPRVLFAAVVVNALPFQRQVNPRQSLNLCRQLLDNTGNVLILFPEGTRSTNGELAEFKPGIGLLLAGTSIPVVPCYLEAAHRAWPKGAWLPRPRRVRLTIGPPREFSHLKPGKAAALQIAAELQAAVRQLADETAARCPSTPPSLASPTENQA